MADPTPTPLTDAEAAALVTAVDAHNTARAHMVDGKIAWSCGCGQPLEPEGPSAAFVDLTSHQAHEVLLVAHDIKTNAEAAARADVVPCSRCGLREVVNPRPGADLVVCEDCADVLARADERERTLREVEALIWRRAVPVCDDNTDDQRLVGNVLRGLSETVRRMAALDQPTDTEGAS